MCVTNSPNLYPVALVVKLLIIRTIVTNQQYLNQQKVAARSYW